MINDNNINDKVGFINKSNEVNKSFKYIGVIFQILILILNSFILLLIDVNNELKNNLLQYNIKK